MKSVLLIGASLCLGFSGAQAQTYSGNELQTVCDLNGDSAEFACNMYILGSLDMYDLLLPASEVGGSKDFCAPTGATVGQIFAVVRQHLEDHPGRRHRNAVDLILEALSDAFPCKGSE